MDNLIRLAPGAEPVGADNHTGCLVLLQEGQVDAITGDDTVLAGLASQDPYAVVLDEAAFTEEPYGIGVPADDVDMVAFRQRRPRADARRRVLGGVVREVAPAHARQVLRPAPAPVRTDAL